MQLLRKNQWAGAWPATHTRYYCYSRQSRPMAQGHRTTRATEQRAEGKRAQEARQAQRSAHRRSQNNRAPTDLGQWSCACKAIHPQCDTWRLRPKTSGPVRRPCPLQHTGAGCDWVQPQCCNTHLDCSARRAAFGAAPALTKMTTPCLARRAAFGAAHHSQQCQHAARLTVQSTSLLHDCE
jgi:hypothetical protein